MKKSLITLALLIGMATAMFALPVFPSTIPDNGSYIFTGFAIAGGVELDIDLAMAVVKTTSNIEMYSDGNMNKQAESWEIENIPIMKVVSGQITAMAGVAPSGPTVFFLKDSRGEYWIFSQDPNGYEVYFLMEKSN